MTSARLVSRCCCIAVFFAGVIGHRDGAIAKEIDLSKAVVVVPDGLSGPENKATRLLVEEVRKRSRVELSVSLRWPTADVPVIAIGPARLFDSFPQKVRERIAALPIGKQKEGFRIQTVADAQTAPVIAIVGNDERGVLFGVGRLLRELHMASGQIALPAELNLASSPKYPASRASAWLSPQDQFLRRLGPARNGSDTSATWPSSAPMRSS